jgi:hypothetical protein
MIRAPKRCLAALACAAALAGATSLTATADPVTPPRYPEAVQRAFDLIQNASGPDPSPAVAAVQALVDGTGNTQPEIINDLQARPPLYPDARARLSALLAALLQPMSTANPTLAAQRLHDVMSMSRYDALHRPPSLIDRFTQWVQDRISDLLRLLFGRQGGPQAPLWWYYAVGIAVVAALVFILVRASRGRFTEGHRPAAGGPRPPADFFAEADRLAARGDRVGAIRALCAGVAATLAGERTWEGSPLTVREIFMRAPDFSTLRALLLPFEAAVYGGRDVDVATYERAAAVAAAFRQPLKEAA